MGMLTVPSCSLDSEHSAMQQYRAAINAGIKIVAEKYKPRVFVVDAATALPNGPRSTLSEEVAALWDEDGLHLSERGSARLAQAVFDTLKTL